jgi:hypothetical protein
MPNPIRRFFVINNAVAHPGKACLVEYIGIDVDPSQQAIFDACTMSGVELDTETTPALALAIPDDQRAMLELVNGIQRVSNQEPTEIVNLPSDQKDRTMHLAKMYGGEFLTQLVEAWEAGSPANKLQIESSFDTELQPYGPFGSHW